ncbi:MAG: hypothetical protein IAG10_02010 [Planctomycetaceae bacterium]|nr:hypothetical protein [Planctomycetaceae bacterium]
MVDTMTTQKSKPYGSGQTAGLADVTTAEGIKSAASYVSDKAKDAASNVTRAAGDAASYLGDKAENATVAVGKRLKAAGDSMDHSEFHEGTLGQASSVVAKTLQETGNYLEREGLHGIAGDVTNLIKKNPVPSLLVGVCLGFLFARATVSRS